MHRPVSRTYVLSVIFVLVASCTLILHPPSPVRADWATPFVEIHNQVGDVSKGHGYLVALSNDEEPTHFLVIVDTDWGSHVVIRATAEKNVVPPPLLGRPVIIEGKVVKSQKKEETGAATVELEILSVESPRQKSNASSESEKVRLGFLEDVPEFHHLHLAITEDELNSLIAENDLLVTVIGEGNDKSYRVYRKDGENLIVIFRDGECSGVQRMRRDISGVPKPE